MAQSEEGEPGLGSDGGEDGVPAADCGVQPDDRVRRLLREPASLVRESAVSSVQQLCAGQPWRVRQLWRERLPVPQVQVGKLTHTCGLDVLLFEVVKLSTD